MTTTGIADLLELTEALLEMPFTTDMDSTEVNVDTAAGDAVVTFAPLRVAAATPSPEEAAAQVGLLWSQHGYHVTLTPESATGSIIVDAHSDDGDTLTCQFNATSTVMTGESAPR